MDNIILKRNSTINYSALIIGLGALLLIIAPLVSATGLTEVGILTDGPSYDLVESDGYLYTAQGTSVHVYDVSTREKIAALTWKSSLETVPTGSPVRGLTIDNGYLYVASETRFSIIDIRHPGIPELQGSVENPYKGAQIRDVVVKGDTAYLAVYGGGIQVVDISDKAAPVFLSKIVLAGKNKPVRCTVDGNYLYVALEADNRLDILDISSPRSPVVTGSYKPGTPGYNSTYSVAVKNGYAYITEYHNGVRVIDVTNPAHPVEVTNLMDINANDIKIRGNYAYVSVRYQGFSIIDITDPRNIRVVGKASDVKYYNEGIYPTDKYTFISLESMGIGIYDTSVVTNPVTLNRINVMGGADATIVRDDYMYIGGHNDGVWIVDISDPARPEEISFLSTRNGRNSVIHLQGNYLYIAGIWAKLCIADVSDPANPRLVVDHFGDNINAVLPDGNYIYTDIGIIDWTNKASPVYVAKSSIFNGKLTKFNDRYLLVAGTLSTNRGLHIIDVSDKKNPRLVTTFDPGISYKDVAVNGNIAVALTGSNITTIDLSSINAPVRLGTASYPGKWSGFGIALNDTIAYAAGSGAGQVRAFDLSDPANIALIDQIQLYGDFDSIAYSDGYVFAGQKMAVSDISTTLISKDVNHAPVMAYIGNKSVNAGESLEITVSAFDPDDDELNYSVGDLPINASFKTTTHRFSWVTHKDQVGEYPVTFSVSDRQLSDNETITISVLKTQHAPILDPIGNKSVAEGSMLDFTISGSDVDGDPLTFAAVNLPKGAIFDSTSRNFSWKPEYDQSGEYLVEFSVSDSVTVMTEEVFVSVEDTNRAPVINPLEKMTLDEGSTLIMNLTGSDPDADDVLFSGSDLPKGSSLDEMTGEFSWTPDFNQSGEYKVRFSISDGLLTESTIMELTVKDVPQTGIPRNMTVNEGELLKFAILPEGQDTNNQQYSLDNLPEGASFNPETGEFSWTPSFEQAGNYIIRMSLLNDGQIKTKSLTAADAITITVINVNRPPVLTHVGNKTSKVGNKISFNITASDPDGDIMTYAMNNLPEGSTYNPNTNVFSWTPGTTQTGTFMVQVSVNDTEFYSCETVSIHVIADGINHQPTLMAIGNRLVKQGEHLEFMITGSDPDNNPLQYSAQRIPLYATFDTTTRKFSWTPRDSQEGEYLVIFRVFDGALWDTQEVTIIVEKTNRAPVFYTVTNKTQKEGLTLSFTVLASDPDGDQIRYSAKNMPEGALFDPVTKTFTWTPNYRQAGKYIVVFSASDGLLTAEKPVEIVITDLEYSPVWDVVGIQTGVVGQGIQFAVKATDMNGDTLTYVMTKGPAGASFNPENQMFSWVPASGQAGSSYAYFTVTDGKNTVSKTVQIVVSDTNKQYYIRLE